MKGKEKEQLYQKRNYDHYHFSMKELLKRSCVLSEMAEKSYDQGKTEESELSV